MKERVLSAIVALSIVVPVLLVGGSVFAVFVMLVGIIAFKEYIAARETNREFPFLVKILAYFIYVLGLIKIFQPIEMPQIFDYQLASLLFISMLIPLVFYHDEKKYHFEDAAYLIVGTFFLVLACGALVKVREFSLAHFVYLILIPMLGDTFAFFSGKLIGSHKLVESISPKKTIEGIVFGTFFAVLIASAFYYIYVNDQINVWILIYQTIVLSIVGSIGDLVFSSMKRFYRIKDFSNLIPGHGGILDRLDSIIFVVLAYVLFMSII